MSITLFITILTIGGMVTALLTEAIKKMYANMKKDYSANIIALVNAIVVGCGGTAVVYMLMNIPWTVNNIICMILMTIAVWIASMLGFDKVLQTVNQIANMSKEKSE
jgi:hypothetical protein